MIDLYLAMATAAVCVLFCTASITAKIRKWTRLLRVLECPFCFSWWVAALAIIYESGGECFTYWFYTPIRLCAIVCLANIGILLIHLSIATMNKEIEDTHW